VYLSGVCISTELKGGGGILGLGDNGLPGWGLKYKVIRAHFGGRAEGLGGGLQCSLGRRVFGTGRLLLTISLMTGKLLVVGWWGSGGTLGFASRFMR